MHSAIYTGWLSHRRHAPLEHAFRVPLFMVYLDLGELDRVFAGRWLWSCRRPAWARFDRRDHFGDAALPLDESVRRLVQEQTGRRPGGPVRLLTHLRYLGHVFNPVSFYYCFDAAGERVETVVAEVTNTPWGERHCYVVPGPVRGGGAGQGEGEGEVTGTSVKAMHVSPFHPMALRYRWHFGLPADALRVHMRLVPCDDDGASPAAPVFDALLAMRRSPISGASLALTLARFPIMTVKVVAAIHWQALKLWLKRVPVHDHPRTRQATTPGGPA